MSRAQILSLWVLFLAAVAGFGYAQYRKVPLVHAVASNARAAARASTIRSIAPPQTATADLDQPVGSTEPTPTAADPRPELANIASEALTAADPVDRGAAIGRLAAVQTPEVMYALSQGLSDSALPNRHLSIESLRLIAANEGDRDGAIRQMLRLAMSDSDAEVAKHARTAFDEVAELAGAAE